MVTKAQQNAANETKTIKGLVVDGDSWIEVYQSGLECAVRLVESGRPETSAIKLVFADLVSATQAAKRISKALGVRINY